MPESSAFHIPSSPIAALGTITLLIAFIVAAYGAAAGIVGNAHKKRRLVNSSIYALYGLFALMMLASALLVYAFISHDFTIKYVAHYSDTSMPLAYKITAYWGGLDGSLMFWVSVLSVFAAVAIKSNARRHADMMGYVVGTIMVVQVFFLALLIYNKNPFATWLTPPPIDGKGLNPLLQNYWMVIHPPSLYTGFVAATIPFAFGIGALASGRLDDQWLASVRIWTLICWFFLSFGLILGGRWAYEELGWGGYWAWDPVENAGLIPWFTATAFLHSIMIQEQRGMMKVWNLLLVITTFFFTVFGTFMTRSGVVQSVHAFGEDNQLALLFILFMGFMLIVSFGLLLFRLPQLRSATTFESFISREFAFLLNNWILLGCAFFVLFATMFPTLSEAVNGTRKTVGPPFFNLYMIPLGLTLVFLSGVAPLMAWRKTSRERLWNQLSIPSLVGCLTIAGLAALVPRTRVLTPILSEHIRLPASLVNFGMVAFTISCIVQEFVRGMRVRMKQTEGGAVTSLIGLVFAKRRKYGGYVIHLGVAVMFFGFGGKAYDSMDDRTVQKPGETFEIRGYTFRYDEVVDSDDDNKAAVMATVSLFDGKVSDHPIATMYPGRFQYKKVPDQPTSEVDISSHLEEDVYLVLTGVDTDNKGTITRVNFRIYVNPLINWVWIGFGILFLGTVICLTPQRWTDKVSVAPRTRVGKLGEVAVLLAIFAAITFGFVRLGRAQGPPGAEHEEQGGGAAQTHMMSQSATQLNRPYDARFLAPFRAKAAGKIKADHPEWAEGSPELEAAVSGRLGPVTDVAARTMRDLVCMCGGCTRETVFECKCGEAAEERGKILAMLSSYDLLDPQQRERAHDEVLAAYVKRFGGEDVLIVPSKGGFNLLSVIVPYAAVAGALIIMFVFGRRWVQRGKKDLARGGKVTVENSTYAEQLDDELRDAD